MAPGLLVALSATWPTGATSTTPPQVLFTGSFKKRRFRLAITRFRLAGEQLACDSENPPSAAVEVFQGYACANLPNLGPAGTYGGPLLAASSYYRWVLNCINGASGVAGPALPLTQHQCARMTATMPYQDESLGYGFGWILAKNGDGSVQ
jgi:hypothetical protein